MGISTWKQTLPNFWFRLEQKKKKEKPNFFFNFEVIWTQALREN